jgi:phage gp46-like protein
MAENGIDAVLEQSADGTWDFQLSDDGDILTADTLDTSIIVSLFTDKRADASEVSVESMRRGWIGNESTPGFEIGSKLWLYYQARLNQRTLNGITNESQNALQWFVEDSSPETGTTIANAVSATAAIVDEALQLEVILERPSSRVEKRYFDLWQNTPVRA